MNPFKTILSAKINTANSQCESLAINQIKAYKEKVQINLHTVSLPNLRDVGKVWTELLFQKKKAFLLETESVMNSILYLEDHDIEYAQKIINDIFSENLYENRLVKFHEEMMRKLASHGRVDIKTRLDLHDCLYKVSIINNTRFIKNQTPTEFKTIVSKRIKDMGIESFMADKVSILKLSGEKFDDVTASVQTTKIFINRSDILIESGDLVHRLMSNGGKETFEVIDPGFHEKFHSIDAGYQMSVKKLGLPEAKAAIQNITYNLSGNNVRVNNNSIDNSNNSVQTSSQITEYLTQLRNFIEQSTPHEEKKSAVKVVDVIEQQFLSGKPSKPVVSALLATLPVVAEIASIVSAIKDFL